MSQEKLNELEAKILLLEKNHFEFAFIEDALEYLFVQLHRMGIHSIHEAAQYFEARGNGSSQSMGYDVGKPYEDFAHRLEQLRGQLPTFPTAPQLIDVSLEDPDNQDDKD